MNQEVVKVSDEEYARYVALMRLIAYKQFKGLLFGLMVGHLIGVYTS